MLAKRLSSPYVVLISTVMLGSLLAACESGPMSAQEVVDASIARHGGDIINNATIEFDFRDAHFVLHRQDGAFTYEKIYTDTLGQVHREVFSNEGIRKSIDAIELEVDSLLNRRIGTAVNSVAYFTLLPIPLNDPAVIKEDLGSVAIKGAPYRKIGITFQQEGGGRDHQDRFLVWIHEEASTMDYFAYYYHTDETGSRFRAVDSVHEVDGIRLADYLNFTYDGLTMDTIERYDVLFDQDSLRLVSEVRLDSVTVSPN